MTDEVLLTNDDGIDATGLRALEDALLDDYSVTVVAPSTNQSGVGGERSWWKTTVEFRETDLGYAVDGTPADCVAVAVTALEMEPDIVVSGCNHGPNIGSHIIGQSGTVGAAMEAAHLGLPGIAVSLYDRTELPLPAASTRADFRHAAEFTNHLVERRLSEGPLAGEEVLNVNAPVPGNAIDPAVRLTEPAAGFEVVEQDPGTDGIESRGEAGMELRDRFWRQFLDMDIPDDIGTDRRATVDGEISVSPLSVSRSSLNGQSGETIQSPLDPRS